MSNVYIKKATTPTTPLSPELSFRRTAGAWRIAPSYTSIPNTADVVEAPEVWAFAKMTRRVITEAWALDTRGVRLTVRVGNNAPIQVRTVPTSVLVGPHTDLPIGSWYDPELFNPVGFNIDGEDVLVGFGGIALGDLTGAAALEWELKETTGALLARAKTIITCE